MADFVAADGSVCSDWSSLTLADSLAVICLPLWSLCHPEENCQSGSANTSKVLERTSQ